MLNEQPKHHLSDECRTMVLNAIEYGMTVTWEYDPTRGDYLDVMHPCRVGCYVTTRAELDALLNEWSPRENGSQMSGT
jgi:hypothetical protein